MKGIHSVLTGTQLPLAAEMQHGVVKALCSMFDRWVFVIQRSPNKGNTELAAKLCHKSDLNGDPMEQDQTKNIRIQTCH